MTKKVFLILFILSFFTSLRAQDYQSALSLFDAGKYKEAVGQFSDICDKAEKRNSPSDSLVYSQSLVYRARCFDMMQQYKKAEQAYLDAKAYYESVDLIYNENYALILNNLAVINENSGNFQNADFMYNQSLLIRKKVLGENHPQTIETLLNIANFNKNTGNYIASEKFFNEVLIATGNVHGNKSIEYVIALHGFASMYIGIDNLPKAEQMLLLAERTVETDTGLNNATYLMIENDLGVIYFNRSEFEKAEAAFTKVCDRKKTMMETFDADYATYLQNLASVYIISGNFDSAEKMLNEALAIISDIYGNKSNNYASIIYTFAVLHREKRNYPAAEAALKESAKIFKKSNGSKSVLYAKSMSGLATIYYDMAKLPEKKEESNVLLLQAEAIYNDVLKIYEINEGNTGFSYINTLVSLAAVYQQQDLTDRAESYLQQAITLMRVAGIDKSRGAFVPFSNLASLYYQTGDFEKCDNAFADCNALFFQLLNYNFRFMSEKEKLLYVESVRYNLEVYKTYLLRRYNSNPLSACDFYNIELASKGMVLNSGIETRKSIANTGDTVLLGIYDEWKTLRSSVTVQYSLPENQRMQGVDSLEDYANKLEKQWTKVCSRNNYLTEVHWQDIQHVLQTNEAAIEFTHFQVCNPDGWTDSVVFAALIVRPGYINPVVVRLCEQSDIDSLIMNQGSTEAGFASRLYRGMVLPNIGNDKNYGKLLYQMVWQPLEQFLEGVDRIYYAPTGVLHQISFAAIPVSDSMMISDKYTLLRLSSTAILTDTADRSFSHPKSIIAYGGISYDTDAETQLAIAGRYYDSYDKKYEDVYAFTETETGSRGGSWDYLPGTLNEVQGIHLLARKNNVKSIPVTGNEAVEEAIKNIPTNESPEIIHIATHGFFFPNASNNDLQQFFGSGEKQQAFRQSNNPLQRAGLLFAGANNSWKGRKLPLPVDDGILTAYEISSLYMPNTRLVVLSACETGIGDIRGDEGVFGLQRAFKTAGVDYIVMSLWKVPDFETSEFMQLFYARMFSGQTVEDAFNGAQNIMRNKYRGEPYKWAAFVLLH